MPGKILGKMKEYAQAAPRLRRPFSSHRPSHWAARSVRWASGSNRWDTSRIPPHVSGLLCALATAHPPQVPRT
jgi:hypothetical protein